MVNVEDFYNNFQNIEFTLFDNKCILLVSYKNDSVKAVCDCFNVKHFEEVKKKSVNDIKFDGSLYNIVVKCNEGIPQTYLFRIFELSSFSNE